MRLDQHRGFCGIAGDGRLALTAQRFDEFAVLLGNDVGDRVRVERRGDAPPDLAVADENDLSFEILALGTHR